MHCYLVVNVSFYLEKGILNSLDVCDLNRTYLLAVTFVVNWCQPQAVVQHRTIELDRMIVPLPSTFHPTKKPKRRSLCPANYVSDYGLVSLHLHPIIALTQRFLQKLKRIRQVRNLGHKGFYSVLSVCIKASHYEVATAAQYDPNRTKQAFLHPGRRPPLPHYFRVPLKSLAIPRLVFAIILPFGHPFPAIIELDDGRDTQTLPGVNQELQNRVTLPAGHKLKVNRLVKNIFADQKVIASFVVF